MPTPPLLPEKILARVERIGRLHGGCVLYVAGIFALLSAMAGDPVGAITALWVAGAGAGEHHGATMLGHGKPDGLHWLVGSQIFLFVGIGAYCAVRLIHFELPPIPRTVRPLLEANAATLGVGVEELLTAAYRLTLKLVLVLSVFYQGGLGLYYFSKRRAIDQALGGEK